jgi:hypothetical protein
VARAPDQPEAGGGVPGMGPALLAQPVAKSRAETSAANFGGRDFMMGMVTT